MLLILSDAGSNGGITMAKDKKKTRRQWLYIEESNLLNTKEAEFDLTLITNQANMFLTLYGCKQYLADVIASKGGSEFSDKERSEAMQDRFNNLCSDKFKLIHTESGFYFKDPNAAPASRGGGVGRNKVVQGLMDKKGFTEEEAIEFWNSISIK